MSGWVDGGPVPENGLKEAGWQVLDKTLEAQFPFLPRRSSHGGPQWQDNSPGPTCWGSVALQVTPRRAALEPGKTAQPWVGHCQGQSSRAARGKTEWELPCFW
jgi:hypothetical protein